MTDYDSPWKEAISVYFRDFLEFFFPKIAADINWQRGFEFLDTELQQIKRETETGKRDADKLVKVWRTDGTETWVLVHIEIQSQRQSKFAERMYLYHSRIFDTYRRPVASLAILADEQNLWRPTQYEQKLWGCRALLKFPRVKLLDYDLSQLEQDSNPFAAIVAAHRTAQQMGEDVQQNYQRKLQLVKSLYQRGLSRNDIVELFRLIDWFIALPAKEEQRLWTEVQSLEKEDQMPYITNVERFGIQKGLQQGQQVSLVRILEVRFGEISSSLREQVSQIRDLEALERLVVQAVNSPSLEAFQSELNSLIREEGEECMPYITSVERFGIKKARQEDIVRILEVRFGEILSSLREQVSQMTDLEALERLVVQAVTIQSLEAFESELNSLIANETE